MREYLHHGGDRLPLQNRLDTAGYGNGERVDSKGNRVTYISDAKLRLGKYDPKFHQLLIDKDVSKARLEELSGGGVKVVYSGQLDLIPLKGILAACRAKDVTGAGQYDDFLKAVDIFFHQVKRIIRATDNIPVPQAGGIDNILIDRGDKTGVGRAELVPPFSFKELIINYDQADGEELTPEQKKAYKEEIIHDAARRVVSDVLEDAGEKANDSQLAQILGLHVLQITEDDTNITN